MGGRRRRGEACRAVLCLLDVDHATNAHKPKQLVMQYLVNQKTPFDPDEPFGLYRHADNIIYDDVAPLCKLKASKAKPSEVKRSEHYTHTLPP